ncbi:MAG: hypothetical protein V3R98_13885 [Alphaproteobacteria bacterium]
MARRLLALWLPTLPTDRLRRLWTRRGGGAPAAPLARCDGIAPRGVPALSARQRRADRGHYEKCGLAPATMRAANFT